MTKVQMVEVKDDPFTIKLPGWVDTNRSYELVWDIIKDGWTVLPF